MPGAASEGQARHGPWHELAARRSGAAVCAPQESRGATRTGRRRALAG